MRNLKGLKGAGLMVVLAAGTGLFAATAALANATVDFSNPATAMSEAAVIASGTCIAKYATALDDRSKPAAEIGRRIAERCAKEISRSAGLASLIVGRPDDYSKNLKYTRDELTTNAVLRARAAAKQRSL